jgi:alkanesulfonate monooxygenase SsuD/methylene tetrahydromethanopterin reductase-like flavin-dependent oxidoreductase (luciferase family)
VKFGLFYELQLPTPWEDGDENRIFREALEHVQLAEQLGFEHMWAVEHHFLDDHSISSSPETWLAAAAALTTRIRIGHGIACTPPAFVHPARLAERISTLDQISNGRVEFGTGESASRMELEGYGVDADTKRAAWFEAVSQVADMMAMTPYPGYEGEFFSMPSRNVIPKPFQKPHPPLWVAGKPGLAAENGMGCIGFNVLSADMAKAAVEAYYDGLNHAVPIGHAVNANIAMLARLHVNHDEDVARERATHLQFFGFSLAQYYLNGPVRPGRSASWPEFERTKANIAPYDETNPKSAIGTPEQVRHHLRTLEEIGVDQVLFMHQGGRMPHDWNCESLELFAREVMPEFAERDEQRQKEKAVRLEPVVAAAMGRKRVRAELRDDEIPLVYPYGTASWIPTNDRGGLAGVTDETATALDLGSPSAKL